MATNIESDMITMYVRLIDESVDVWRPVFAKKFGGDLFEITLQEIPEDEIWEFKPGDLVKAQKRYDERGAYCAAVRMDI